MIYLIDKVLPESYFANNLQALSGKRTGSHDPRGGSATMTFNVSPASSRPVDMAVFRDLLRVKLPRLSQHLHHLQKSANKEAGGKSCGSACAASADRRAC